MNAKTWIVVGSLLGGLAVAAGAFGAHGLESRLKPEPEASQAVREASAKRLHTFEVAVRYQMYHALALVLVGVLAQWNTSAWLQAAGWAFLAGMAIFSGCLYLWVLTQQRIFALIVPLGGMAMIVGWLLLAAAAAQAAPPAAGPVQR